MTSPIFRGRYFDINDTSAEGEEAYEFNMILSNDRALAMYNFIFDSHEMGDYEYRARLKGDLGISALGYQTATPVPSELVGQRAKCLEYDCKKRWKSTKRQARSGSTFRNPISCEDLPSFQTA